MDDAPGDAMTFRTDRQLATVARLLCERAGLLGAWTDAGPTAHGLALAGDDSDASPNERTVARVALDLWHGEGGALVADLFNLDHDTLADVAALLEAINSGADAVDRWVEDRAPRTGPRLVGRP